MRCRLRWRCWEVGEGCSGGCGGGCGARESDLCQPYDPSPPRVLPSGHHHHFWVVERLPLPTMANLRPPPPKREPLTIAPLSLCHRDPLQGNASTVCVGGGGGGATGLLLTTQHRWGLGGVGEGPTHPPLDPPPKHLGQNFLRVFGQSTFLSGAFGANWFRPKNFFGGRRGAGPPPQKKGALRTK